MIDLGFEVVRIYIVNTNYHLMQSLRCSYTGGKISGSMVLVEVGNAIFVILRGDEFLLVLALSIS